MRINRKYFNQILSFTQHNLQGCFTNKFFLDYTLNRFVFLRENIEGYLYDHQVLGAHTNLYIFSSEAISESTPGPKATMFFWSHPGQRPMSNRCPQQCPDCFALRPWTPKSHADKVEHKCKGCGKIISYYPIPRSIKIELPGLKGDAADRGTWWKRKAGEA